MQSVKKTPVSSSTTGFVLDSDGDIQITVTELEKVFNEFGVCPVFCFNGKRSCELTSLLKDTVKQSKFKKRVLCILADRDLYPTIMISHKWTYGDLLSEIDPTLKCVEICRNCELEVLNGLWDEISKKEFHILAEDLDKTMKEFIKKVDQLKVKTDQKTNDSVNDKDVLSPEFLDQMETLRKEKVYLKAHIDMTHNILKSVKGRQLDKLYYIEDKLLRNDPVMEDPLMTLADPTIGDIFDKARLFFICNITKWFYGVPENFKFEYDVFMNGLEDELKKSPAMGSVVMPLKDELLGSSCASSYLFEWVKSRFEKSAPSSLYLKDDVHVILESGLKSMNGFTLFDPMDEYPDWESLSKEVIVFIPGSGNYSEWQSLSGLSKKICYGCEYTLSPIEYLDGLIGMIETKKGIEI